MRAQTVGGAPATAPVIFARRQREYTWPAASAGFRAHEQHHSWQRVSACTCQAGPQRDYAMLEIRDLSTAVIGPLSLAVAPGQCVAISGPSGSGKSLLLRAIADLDPWQGEILLDETPAHAMSAADWRRQVQLLPAEPQWWASTVAEHFPPEADVDATRLGFGADVWQWPVERLSSGEKQRLALLRALARRPRVLLLDEPTANLDDASASRVEALVADYRSQHQAMVVWVSHAGSQRVRVADCHYSMDAGHLWLEAA